ncbi:succinate dehydrogenase assembly factor 2 [Rhodobacterales bacterium LSUCC0246]|nr:succinate dehydrogenase assembly factor 2 [Rhodobacterales bacterium LSUCC0374]
MSQSAPQETREIRLKRLRMRAWHRGIKEMDLILGGWADAHLAYADDATLDQFETVLEEADQDLYQWISDQKSAPVEIAGFLQIIGKQFGQKFNNDNR